MHRTDDSLQQAVLDTIQSGFPLEADPYGVLANRFEASRDEIKDAVYGLCVAGGVRRVGASFDSRKLGYTSTLCALAVPGGEEEVFKAAEIVNVFPGVTHNYGRAHRYNMWFTLITRSLEQKHEILGIIREATGCDDLLDMPSIRKYKVSVDFGRHRAADKKRAGGEEEAAQQKHAPSLNQSLDRTTREVQTASSHRSDASKAAPEDSGEPFSADNAFDVELVRWAQDDIARDEHGELIDDPYIAGATHLNAALGRSDIEPEHITARLAQLKAAGTIRRFGAMVRHQKIGFAHNSMTVWDIPDEVVDAAGELFASAHFVSHCYTRPRSATWPTNLYAMTHAQTAEELMSNIETLQVMLESQGIECRQYFALETTNEYKKVSMRYFLEEHTPPLKTH